MGQDGRRICPNSTLVNSQTFLAIYVTTFRPCPEEVKLQLARSWSFFSHCSRHSYYSSWGKLVLGSCVKWLGWMVHLGETSKAHLPEDQHVRRKAGSMVSRKHLEQLVGLLSWFASGVRWLRPWLRQLLFVLHKPSVVLRASDSAQLTEICQVVSVEGEIHTCPFLSEIMQCKVGTFWKSDMFHVGDRETC